MTLVERVKNICLTPNTEWPVIAQEPTTPKDLMTGYVIPLAAIGAVAGFIGGSLVGYTLPYIETFRVSVVNGLVTAIFTVAIAVIGCFVLSLIINALAPNFGGQKDSNMALKVAVYSYTPAWVAGVLQVLPALSILAILAGLYGLYLLYLGLPRLMKCPPDKAIGYTVVVVICAIVVGVALAAVGAMIGIAGRGGVPTFGSTASSSPSSQTQVDPNSPLGRLQELGNKLDESNKKIEAAEKSGDANAQANAALEAFGTLLGGGRRVDPIAIDQLKPLVPETFAGLPRTSSNAEKSGIGTLMVSKAEATYSDGNQKTVRLEISDSGGASGLVGLATWAGIQGEQDNDSATERVQKVGGRLVHERVSKTGGDNEFGVILGERFIVNATGSGVDINQLRRAVTSLDLSKLEGMKDVGVQK